MYLEIVTPEASIVTGEVESVTVPGVKGPFQMLNNHAAIVSLLNAGQVKFRGNPTITEGFEENFTSPYWSELSHGGAVIGIHGGGDETEKNTGLSIQYEDVRAVFDIAMSGGVVSVEEPHSREGEPIILSSVRDTEGNLIMLTQYTG